MNDGPSPLVLAVIGAPRARARLAARVAQALARRGLRIQALRTARARPDEECDVVVVPCRTDRVSELTALTERVWTSTWTGWYAARQRH